jgi:hypothetical protein
MTVVCHCLAKRYARAYALGCARSSNLHPLLCFQETEARLGCADGGESASEPSHSPQPTAPLTFDADEIGGVRTSTRRSGGAVRSTEPRIVPGSRGTRACLATGPSRRPTRRPAASCPPNRVCRSPSVRAQRRPVDCCCRSSVATITRLIDGRSPQSERAYSAESVCERILDDGPSTETASAAEVRREPCDAESAPRRVYRNRPA